MDATNLRLLKSMREQIRGKNNCEVYAGAAAHEFGMVSGSRRHYEYKFRLNELLERGYLQRHHNPVFGSQEVYLITDTGITIAG